MVNNNAKKLGVEQFLEEDEVSERVKELSFEQGLHLLEELVSTVEAGNLPLDRAVRSYEKGVTLIEHLRSQLEGAEEKLRVLQKEPAGGKKGER